MTVAPADEKASAIARPLPELDPVTMPISDAQAARSLFAPDELKLVVAWRPAARDFSASPVTSVLPGAKRTPLVKGL
jgi:hypothetical protein